GQFDRSLQPLGGPDIHPEGIRGRRTGRHGQLHGCPDRRLAPRRGRGNRLVPVERPALARSRLPDHHPHLAHPAHGDPRRASVIKDLRRAAVAISPLAWAVIAVLLVAVAVLPLVVSSYITALALSIAMYTALAASWNMI